MPIDPRAKRLLTMIAATGSAERQRPTLDERRQSLAKLMQFSRARRVGRTMADVMLDSASVAIPGRLYAPQTEQARPAPGIVFFHGGGLVAGSIATHDVIAAALAEASGCRVVSVGYRLAPEHRYPAAVEDAIAAVACVARDAASLGIDPARLAVAGDSAGATLAAIVCQTARVSGTPAIAVQCLICPVLDFAEESGSRRDFADDALIPRATLQADLADYLAGLADVANPHISPLRAADLSGLPPAIIHTAEFDPMRDEGNAYADRLSTAGVPVSHTCHPGMVHNFHAMGALLPQGLDVLEQIGCELRVHLAG